MFSIQFNNYNSYKDLSLVVEHKPVIPSPERNISTIEVPGRNGTLTEDFGTYKDISFFVQFGFEEKNEFESTLIKSWLNNIKNRNLILSSDTDMVYKVKYAHIESIDRSEGVLRRFTVEFICEPFFYFLEGLETIGINNNSYTIYNEGTFESQPYLKIFGSGDITLNINDQTIKFTDINNYIELDSELMECYKDNENCNNKMIGEFPILQVGENKINWIGDIEKIEIIPNWRCL